jgi:hypothetical protein
MLTACSFPHSLSRLSLTHTSATVRCRLQTAWALRAVPGTNNTAASSMRMLANVPTVYGGAPSRLLLVTTTADGGVQVCALPSSRQRPQLAVFSTSSVRARARCELTDSSVGRLRVACRWWTRTRKRLQGGSVERGERGCSLLASPLVCCIPLSLRSSEVREAAHCSHPPSSVASRCR